MINEGHVFLGDDGTATVHFHPKEEENEGKYQIFLNAKKKKMNINNLKSLICLSLRPTFYSTRISQVYNYNGCIVSSGPLKVGKLSKYLRKRTNISQEHTTHQILHSGAPLPCLNIGYCLLILQIKRTGSHRHPGIA